MRQGVSSEPLLQAISDFLDDQQDIIERVRRDLGQGLRKPRSGCRGLTPQQLNVAFQRFDVPVILPYGIAFIAIVQAIETLVLQPLKATANQ